MNDTLVLTDKKVLEQSRNMLKNDLTLNADGYKCCTEDLLNVLLGVASDQGTLESVCAELAGTPDPQTIRNYINEQICVEQLPQLAKQLNQALTRNIPPHVWRQPRDVALDFHDRPYYGKQPQEHGYWVRGKAKDGTTRFYRIATAYVIVKGLRFTLGISFVLPEDDTVSIAKKLCQRVRGLHIQIRCLLLDRGFAGVEVQTYLEKEQIPALIACPIRGKSGGTKALCRGRKGYRTRYTFNGTKQTAHTAELVVCRVFTTAKRTKRLKRRATWWLFILIHLDLSPRQVRCLYRRRFGIETSYRCAAKVRGWTTSANPAYRFFLMGLSLFLLNVWMILRWLFAQKPRRGKRLLDTKLFQLSRFARFIIHALEEYYGSVNQITAVASPLL